MITMKASEIAATVGGVLHGDDTVISAPAFLSSRDCLPGSIFLAIKGENVDGHDFVGDAASRGAAISITSRVVPGNCVVVADVTRAIGLLAAHVRSQLKNLTVIGITGSQGKTTTKELLASVLSAKGLTVSPKGNHNNELGVPLTVLQCDEKTEFCIAEMGARHQGDIAALAAIAQPHIGVVLRVAAAHIGEFGSIEKIAETKSEMIQSLCQDDIAILGTYDDYTPAMASLHHGRTITFGENTSATIRATDIELRDGRAHFDLVTPEGRSTVALRQYGIHQIGNALAAAAVAHAVGISTDHIAGSLSTAEVHARWRMEVRELEDLVIINDAYNASPDSMAAALTTLTHLTQERGGESWAFLGNMRELGATSSKAHAEIAALASQLGVDHLVAIAAPDYKSGIGPTTMLHECASVDEAIEFVKFINRGDVILCKASRSDKLEVVAEGLEDLWNTKIAKEEGDKK